MLEIECTQWEGQQAFANTIGLRAALQTVISGESHEERALALNYIELCASDLGPPAEILPAVVGALVAVATRSQGARRSDILLQLEELTCGRGLEGYSADQSRFLRDAVRELTYGLHVWVEVLEGGSTPDATYCVDLLAYCGEAFPELRDRVRTYFDCMRVRRPELAEEIDAVLERFDGDGR